MAGEQHTTRNNINWFPGHMARTRRIIKESLPLVDIVIEVLDARIPLSSRNPEIKKLVGGKPIISVFNKISLADPDITARAQGVRGGGRRLCLYRLHDRRGNKGAAGRGTRAACGQAGAV